MPVGPLQLQILRGEEEITLEKRHALGQAAPQWQQQGFGTRSLLHQNIQGWIY